MLFPLILISCEDDEGRRSSCDDIVVISADDFDNGPNASVSIINVSVIDDCLQIEYGASGCDGNSWVIDLVDSDEVDGQNRHIRLALQNTEACLAFFTRSVSYDISALQIQGLNEVILNLTNWEIPITYAY